MAEIKKRILAVDDDSVTRMLVKCALNTDYEVIDAEDTDIALSNIKDTLPDLILLDINMPGENGFSFFSLLKTNSEWSKIPVIFLTGMSDSCTETSCFDSGAYDYIAKPVNPQILRHRIARVLEYAVLRKKTASSSKESRRKMLSRLEREKILLYLKSHAENGPRYVKARDISSELHIPARAVGKHLVTISKEETSILVKRWCTSNSITWYVEKKS